MNHEISEIFLWDIGFVCDCFSLSWFSKKQLKCLFEAQKSVYVFNIQPTIFQLAKFLNVPLMFTHLLLILGLWAIFFIRNCRETFVNTFMLQIAVLSNHLNGRDTHVRQIKVYGPRLCVFSLLQFSFPFLPLICCNLHLILLLWFVVNALVAGTLFRTNLFSLLQGNSSLTPLWDEKCIVRKMQQFHGTVGKKLG